MTLTREQLIERKQRLGASEAAAALGLSPWLSPLELWQDKVAPDVVVSTADENPIVEWGTRLERAILDKYLQSNNVCAIEAPASWRVSARYPWLGCTPDAVLADRLVEVKTAATARDWGEPGTDDVPPYYVIQCMQQMLVCEVTRVDVAVLIAGHDYREYVVSYDQELAKELIERTWSFWRHVMNATPPDVQSIADAARRWPREVTGSVRVATDPQLDALFAIRELKREQEKIDEQIDALGLELRKAIGDAEALITPSGEILATWKAQNRTTFDSVAFKKADPKRWAEFARTASSRVFRLTE